MEIKLNLSDSHLVAGVLAADHAKKIEKQYQEDAETPGEYDSVPPTKEHSAMVSSCIISTFSFLEGFVNETYESVQTVEQFKKALAAHNELTQQDFTQYSTLNKYQAILAGAGHNTFPKGEEPFQEVYWLRMLRNYLVHYEPDTIGSGDQPRDEETNLESALRDRVDPNPLYSIEDESFLPRLALSHSCCEWAILSAIEFVEEFRTQIGDQRTLTYIDRLEPILESDMP